MDFLDDVAKEITKAVDATPLSMVAESMESLAGIGKIVAPTTKALTMISKTFGDLELFDDSPTDAFKKVARMAENLNPLPAPPEEIYGQRSEQVMLNPQPLPPKELAQTFGKAADKVRIRAIDRGIAEKIDRITEDLNPQPLPPADLPPEPEEIVDPLEQLFQELKQQTLPQLDLADELAAVAPGEERLVILAEAPPEDEMIRQGNLQNEKLTAQAEIQPEDELGHAGIPPEDELMAQAEVPPEDEMERAGIPPEDELMARAEVPEEEELLRQAEERSGELDLTPQLEEKMDRDFLRNSVQILQEIAPKISQPFNAKGTQTTGLFAQSMAAELKEISTIAQAIQTANENQQRDNQMAHQHSASSGSALKSIAKAISG
ncbi:MAG: hypothetical protein K2X77_30665 [Candidatus Obscuribacterales bacterium]|nr:hypothetical protein [Candidatus Obscuribacterales bacterium]